MYSTFTSKARCFYVLFFMIAFVAKSQSTNQFIKNSVSSSTENIQKTAGNRLLGSGSVSNNLLPKSSLRFTENKGQVADRDGKLRPDILFTASSKGVKLFITANGIYYQFTRSFEKKDQLPGKEKSKQPRGLPEIDSTQTYRLDMQLIGANKHPQVIKEGAGQGYENYYLAHCSNGIMRVKNYDRITFKEVYPGIDWVVYAKGGTMEYDFVVRPRADVTKIRLKYDGADNISVDKTGALNVTTTLGTVTEQKPLSFQQHKEVESRFILDGNILGFECKYDNKVQLTIDPDIVWSTYYGGSGNEESYNSFVDAEGNIYLTGYTYSSSGIASGGYQTFNGGSADAFLLKTNSAGTVEWATYYGGANNDYGYGCTADNEGHVYLSGSTNSPNGISFNGYQNTLGGSYDAFLVKFEDDGTRLWGTYYGGEGMDGGVYCLLDKTGDIYIPGITTSFTGIAHNGFQNEKNYDPNFLLDDAFLAKFDENGSILWATYYGGELWDWCGTCVVDNLNNVYLAGTTGSTTAIAYNGFQNTNSGGNDGFVVKFTPSGSRVWATYLGGNATEQLYGCAIDPAGIYVCGSTYSGDNIIGPGYDETHNPGEDGFLMKFTDAGQKVWGIYYGGSQEDGATFCSTDNSGNIFITGYTYSTNNIAQGGFQNVNNGGRDCFLAKFNQDGVRAWGTYFGGIGDDMGYSISVNNNNDLYLSGKTSSASGLGINGFQNTNGGMYDGFLTKISQSSDCIAPTLPSLSLSRSSACAGSTDTLRITSGVLNSATNWQWYKDSCGGTALGTGPVLIVSPLVTTAYYARGEGGCNSPGACAGITVSVTPLAVPSVSIDDNPLSNTICAGTKVTFTAVPVNGGTNPVYQWKKNNNNVGTNSSKYTDSTLNNNDSVWVVMTTNTPCYTTPNAVSNKFIMTVNALPATPVTSPSGTIAICSGDSTGISAPGGYNSYLWNTNATSQSISVKQAGGYKVTISDANGCKAISAAVVVNVNALPPKPSTSSSGTIQLCEGSAFGLAAGGSAFTSFLWSNGEITQSITVSNPGTYTVTGTDVNGCRSTSDPVVFNGIPKPPPPVVSPPGDQQVCTGSQVTVTANAGYVSYLWVKQSSTTAGIPGQSVSLGTAGIYVVEGTAANGCKNSSLPFLVTVNPKPAKPVITSNADASNICPGKTVIFTSSPEASYLWSTGATTQSIVVTAQGNYSDIVKNSYGCSSVTSNTIHAGYQTCQKPVSLTTSLIKATSVKVSWAAASCAVGYQYEWRKKGTTTYTTAQTNLISRTITGLTPNTTYQWRVITACKISPDTLTSAGYTNGTEFTTLASVAVTAGSGTTPGTNIQNGLQAMVYPNPASSDAHVAVSNAKGAIEVALSDVNGKILWQSNKTYAVNISIPIQRLAQGIYMVQVKDDNKTLMMKLMKN